MSSVCTQRNVSCTSSSYNNDVSEIVIISKDIGSSNGAVGSSSCSTCAACHNAERRGSTFWGRLARSTDVWKAETEVGDEEDEYHEYDYEGNKEADLEEKKKEAAAERRFIGRHLRLRLRRCTDPQRRCRSLKRVGNTLMSHPGIIFITLLTLAALCAAGMAAVLVFSKRYEEDLQTAAIDKAEEIGYFVSRELDKALLPLFTMAQFVQHLDTFKALPHQIGPRDDPNSAPPLNGKNLTHRNVTGICDDPTILTEFNAIAAAIKQDAKMEKILVNVQLAPQSVVCMLYPVVNTDDFDDGIVMDNSGAIGHDLLNDPNRVAIARATVPVKGVVIAGPLTLIQGNTRVMQEALIARLAINMDNYTISLDGTDYPCWGFAVILLNWEALKQQLGIYDMFHRLNMEFTLTRTDTLLNKTTHHFYDKVAVIAKSNNSQVLNDHNSIKVPLNTTNNEWILQAGYESGFSPPWKPILYGCVVIPATFLTVMIMMLLIVKQEQKNLLYRMMPPTIIKQLQKGETTIVEKYDVATVFVSNILGLTTLTGQMRPLQVMKLLDKLYVEFDKLAKKHGLQKIEAVGNVYIVVGGTGGGSLDNNSNDNTNNNTNNNNNNKCAIDGAEQIALFALETTDFVKNFKMEDGINVFVRAGVASGPVVAGVIGESVPKYTLFGDTVNLATDMESTGKKMKIQCSDTTQRLLRDARNHVFQCEGRREGNDIGVYVKGRGLTHTWWINGSSPSSV